jgi:hypothetical protein
VLDVSRLVSARLLLVAPAVAVALAAGCGGDDDTSATTAWAGDVCSAISTWTESMRDVSESVRAGGLSEDALSDAVEDAKSTTDAFVDDLRELGAPETDAGEEAQAALDELADDLDQATDTIDGALADVSGAGDVLSAISVVTGALASMGEQVAAAFRELEQLDAAGELEDAFREADSCDEIAGSS